MVRLSLGMTRAEIDRNRGWCGGSRVWPNPAKSNSIPPQAARPPLQALPCCGFSCPPQTPRSLRSLRSPHRNFAAAMAIPCTGYFLARAPNPAHAISRHGSQSRSGSRFLQGESVVRFNVDNLRHAPFGRLPWMSGTGRSSVLNLRAEAETEKKEEGEKAAATDVKVDLEKDISKVVRKTAATFAPRASSAKSKNPAQPGTTLYSIFEIQAYISMVVGGILSFNLLFPSDHPDIWRLMGMWSVWMFTIPSLRARDCPGKEKEALNYLFLAIPLINVTLPLVWKSFPAVWSADVLAFFAMYAWKLEWIGNSDNKAEDSNQ